MKSAVAFLLILSVFAVLFSRPCLAAESDTTNSDASGNDASSTKEGLIPGILGDVTQIVKNTTGSLGDLVGGVVGGLLGK